MPQSHPTNSEASSLPASELAPFTARIEDIKERCQFPSGKPIYSPLYSNRGRCCRISATSQSYMLHRIAYFVVHGRMNQIYHPQNSLIRLRCHSQGSVKWLQLGNSTGDHLYDCAQKLQFLDVTGENMNGCSSLSITPLLPYLPKSETLNCR